MRGIVPGLLVAVLTLSAPVSAPSARRGPPEPIQVNDNRLPAGQLAGGVLTLRLEARRGVWYPDGEDAPGIEVDAFAEELGPLRIPGPLLRVKQGTEIHAFVRNRLPEDTLFVHGLVTHDGTPGPEQEPLTVIPGAVREVRFKAGAPGTYYYWSATTAAPDPSGPYRNINSQLAGAFVVDGEDTPADRIFVIGTWTERPVAELDDATPVVFRMTINGRSWPGTEPLHYAQGDTVRWRVINASRAPHPMHLHGFYFRVQSRGDHRADSTAAVGFRPVLGVTERLPPGRTFALSWVPERAGNWLFHCHDNVHIRPTRPFRVAVPPATAPGRGGMAMDHSRTGMAGLVMGVHVRPRGEQKTAPETARRRLRLVAGIDAGGGPGEPAYAFSLEEPGRSPASSPSLPGPPIVLTRGEPVSITVVNELPEPTAVHWHGIELDSYFDGVAGFAGQPGRIAPTIVPRDSFEARFTPPRAGTFIYHTHVDEVRQQRAGLSGPLIVLEPGTTFDARRDLVLFITTPRRNADRERVFLNGSTAPDTLRLNAGSSYRVRVVNIHTYRPGLRLVVRGDSGLVQWRALAKDGADLPPERATVRPAVVPISNGETYDFELVASAPASLRVEVQRGDGQVAASMPVRVR